MEITAIIQARMGSSRLPGKVLMDICGKPVLWHVVNRISKSKYIGNIVIATSDDKTDDALSRFAENNGTYIYRGSQYNVLERYYKCACIYNASAIIRFTGDNVLVDPHIIDNGIEYFNRRKNVDYIYYREGLPVGMAVEIFTFRALETAYYEAVDSECLEHVTPYIYKNSEKYKIERVKCIGEDYNHLRWTLDTKEDYLLLSEIYGTLYKNERNIFYYEDILEQYKYHKEWQDLNSCVKQKKIIYNGEKLN